MFGKSLTRPIIEPLVEQIKVAEKTKNTFITAGLFELDGLQIQDGKSHFGLNKCYSLDFKVKKNEYRRQKKYSSNKLGKLKRKIHEILFAIKCRRNFHAIEESIHVFHCQGLFAPGLTNYIIKHKVNLPIVVSCWGSDIFRVTNFRMLWQQKKLLKRANVITVSSPEFREILLAKFGQDLREKIKISQFSPTLKGVLAYKEESIDGFHNRHNIEKEKIIVGLAHNGNPNNQHIPLIQSLSNVDTAIKKKIHLILPMTYGAGEEYRKKIIKYLNESDFSYTVLTEYMSDEEVIDLRCSLKIFIYAPVTDAFSATVSQALAAGSECILGSWLPYKLRKNAGFLYTEIDSPENVCDAFEKVFKEKLLDKKRITHNRELSKTFFNENRLGSEWLNIYKSIN